MNLLKLGNAMWIVVLNLILILTFIIVLFVNQSPERFINYPQMLNPIAVPASNSNSGEAAAANNNYAAILMFLQQNPQKSTKFIMDIKQKFFKSTCEVKDNINFTNLAQMPNGMPFSS